MVSAKNATPTHPAFAIFRTSPKMTKHEIKEYLTKIYDLPVKKVNTMNYLGEFQLFGLPARAAVVGVHRLTALIFLSGFRQT